jgi:hypothetical protein
VLRRQAEKDADYGERVDNPQAGKARFFHTHDLEVNI